MTTKESSECPRVVIRVRERDLVSVARLPIAARNILTAKIAGCGNILVVINDPSLKEAVTAALDRTTVSVSPSWINANDLSDALVSEETVIHIDSGVLVNHDLIRSTAQLAVAKRSQVVTVLNQAGEVVAWCGPGNSLPPHHENGRIKLSRGVDKIHEHAPADSSFYVDGTEDIVGAEKWIFRNLQKKTDGFVSRRLNRPISTRISRYLARTSIKPIHLTGLTALSALATFLTLLIGGSGSIVIGCILFHATSVIDGFDGEIARAKFLATPFGAGLDTAVDMTGNILFFTGLTIALYVEYGTPYHLLGIYILLTATMSVVLLSIVLRFGPGGGSFDTLAIAVQARLERWPKTARIVSAVERLLKRDFFAFATAVVALTGMAHVVPWFLAGGMTLWFLAILFNAQYILHANAEEITPKHLHESQQ